MQSNYPLLMIKLVAYLGSFQDSNEFIVRDILGIDYSIFRRKDHF